MVFEMFLLIFSRKVFGDEKMYEEICEFGARYSMLVFFGACEEILCCEEYGVGGKLLMRM